MPTRPQRPTPRRRASSTPCTRAPAASVRRSCSTTTWPSGRSGCALPANSPIGLAFVHGFCPLHHHRLDIGTAVFWGGEVDAGGRRAPYTAGDGAEPVPILLRTPGRRHGDREPGRPPRILRLQPPRRQQISQKEAGGHLVRLTTSEPAGHELVGSERPSRQPQFAKPTLLQPPECLPAATLCEASARQHACGGARGDGAWGPALCCGRAKRAR
jgi:hypothetical protein